MIRPLSRPTSSKRSILSMPSRGTTIALCHSNHHKRTSLLFSAEVKSVKSVCYLTFNYLPLHKWLQLRSASSSASILSTASWGPSPTKTYFFATQRQIFSPVLPTLAHPLLELMGAQPHNLCTAAFLLCPSLLKDQGSAPCSGRLVTSPLSFFTLYQPFPR